MTESVSFTEHIGAPAVLATVDAKSYRTLADKIIELFNPFESDEEELTIITRKLEQVYAFVEDLNCSCEFDGFDAGSCDRCKVLGRFDDERVE